MRDYKKILVEPFPIINLLKCDILREVNQHFTAEVSGYVPEETEVTDLIEQANNGACISILEENDNPTIIFKGYIEDVQVFTENSLKKLTFRAVTRSKLLDQKRMTRTFQDETQLFKDVLNFIADNNDKTAFIYPKGDECTNGIEVQYHETDWEFAKRLASQIYTVIVPDNLSDNTIISFGLPKRSENYTIETPFVRTRKIVGEYIFKKAYEVPDFSEHDAIEWIVDDREYYNVATPITLNSISLLVYRVESYLDGGEFRHRYYLRKPNGFNTRTTYNSRLVGAALDGTIIGVKQDVVQVHVHCDPALPPVPHWWPFSTVYSTPDGTGWYCMPEIGDECRLYFPDDHENNSYVLSSVNLENPNTLRQNPDYKSFRSVYNKEVEFTPTTIMLTNHKGMRIVMDDDHGIKIESDKNVEIVSTKDVIIASNTKVDIRGTNGVLVKQKDNLIDINDAIHEVATSVTSK